jgi:hypothetical protein
MDRFGDDLFARTAFPLDKGSGMSGGQLPGDVKDPLHLGTFRHDGSKWMTVLKWCLQRLYSP